jgi:iron complex transport system substrate-binding protein
MISSNDLSGAIVIAALEIHMKLGPGLLESVYHTILARGLIRRGLRVERQKSLRTVSAPPESNRAQ